MGDASANTCGFAFHDTQEMRVECHAGVKFSGFFGGSVIGKYRIGPRSPARKKNPDGPGAFSKNTP